MSLQHAILVLLENKPCTGYDIAKEFDNSISYIWNSTHQQVYLELAKLSKNNLVKFEVIEQSTKPSKKLYTITQPGIDALIHWLQQSVSVTKIKDPFMIKLASGHLADPAILLKELLQQREVYNLKMEMLNKFERYYHTYDKNFQERFRLKYLSLKRAIQITSSWIEWSTEVEITLLEKINLPNEGVA